MNINHSNTNTFGSRSYAQVISQSPPPDNQYQNNISNDTTGIKELPKQSIKNAEMLIKMINEQNTVLRQHTQQITVMLQLLTNMLSKKENGHVENSSLELKRPTTTDTRN